ncbi:MAG TPA: phage portal protein [Thermodesulfobacteriota bacterium]
MGFFQISWGKDKRGSIHNPNTPLTASNVDELIFGISSQNETKVNSNTALNVAAFYRGLRIRSDIISSMSLNVMEETPEGKQISEKSPAQEVLKFPNEVMTSLTVREVSQAQTDIWGDGLIEIKRKLGRPVELWPLESEYTDISVRGRKIAYKYHPPGEKERMILAEDIIHIKNFSLDNFTGLGLIAVAKKAIGYGLSGQEQAKKYIEKNAVPPGVLGWTGAGRLRDDQRKTAKTSWDRARRNGGTAVLDGSWEYKTLILPPDQMQFLESRKFSVLEIARFVGVDPYLLYDPDKQSYASVEQQNINFLQYTMYGIIKRWEEELTRKLLSTNELRKGNIGIRFNMNSLLRGDSTARSNFYRQLWSLGAMNADKIADLEDLPKPSGGDRYWTQLGFAPADRTDFGVQNEKKNGKARKEDIFLDN